MLLSDGWLSFASSTHKNARLGFKQSLSHSEYVWFVFNLLSHYCSINPSLTSGIRAGKPVYGLQFSTRALPCFSTLHSIFYVDGVKIVPQNIYNLLTPVALAHLIMGDGSAQRHGLIICTDSYTIPEVVRLINVLMIRYRLECALRLHITTYPRIYIRQGSMAKLQAIVGSYMLSSMLYKIGK